MLLNTERQTLRTRPVAMLRNFKRRTASRLAEKSGSRLPHSKASRHSLAALVGLNIYEG